MAKFALVWIACSLFVRIAVAAPWVDLALVQRHAVGAGGNRREIASHANSRSPPPTTLGGAMGGTLNSSTVIENNLGGMGPTSTDSPVITFANAFTVDSIPITVTIQNLSAYAPASEAGVKRNGRGGDANLPFGLVNMKCGSSTELRFSFHKNVNGSLVPVTLDNVQFTFMDMDSDLENEVREYVGVSTPIDTHYLGDPTELVSYNISNWSGIAWISTQPGRGSNNPRDVMGLTPDQRKRTVMVELSNVSYIDTILGLTYRQNCKGRNIMFAFKSSMDSTPAPTPSPTKTPSPTQPNSDVCSTCVIWGDPHIITFDAYERRLAKHPRREAFFRTREWKTDQSTVSEAGSFWLVKSSSVRIQGHYEKNETSGSTYLASLVVGGPFLENHVLSIQPLNGKSAWEGEEILSFMPSAFDNELVHATYHSAAKMVKDGSSGPGIDVTLPMGVSLVVNRWEHMLAAEITMCQTTEQSGQCGSFA